AGPGPPQNRTCDFHRIRLKQASKACRQQKVQGWRRQLAAGSWCGLDVFLDRPVDQARSR
ncbi:MAG: hypothetical protein M3256_10835, partial [Actinomycetota bacterium]|nr:hypothetical protein [Actinomycetota bacterium]